MNQSDIVKKLSEELSDSTYKEVHDLLRSVVDYMENALVEGGRFEIRGFGVLKARGNNPRRSRNPRSGKEIWIESRRYGHFKPSRKLLQQLDTSNSDSNPDSDLE
ncbi:MAG: HU family DNA-binding protein [Gammaproteobacteria bacterium]